MQLVRKQWVENFRLYLFSVLALISILGIIFLFWFNTSDNNFNENSLYIIFFFGLFIAGGVFASMSFSMLGEKEKGTFWLILPASHLEKLLCIIFYNLIVFTLVYCACFFLLKTLAITYIQNLIVINPSQYHFKPIDWNNNDNGRTLPYLMYAFFAVQAFYLLGSVYFARFSFVLTTVMGAVLIGAFIWSGYYLSKNMLPEGFNWNGNYVYTNISEKSNNYNSYQLSGTLFNILSFMVKFIWAPVFWIAAWYRLKEKEI